MKRIWVITISSFLAVKLIMFGLKKFFVGFIFAIILLLILNSLVPHFSLFAISNFSKSSSNPILTTGPTSWDSSRAWQPTTIYNDAIYRMYYSGFNGSRFQIGLATSTDGIIWSKASQNPVLSRLSIDNKDVHDPTALLVDGIYYMWYVSSDNGGSGNFSINRATSTDGIAWTLNPSTPVFRPTSGWGSGGVTSPFVTKIGSEYKMWFSSADNGNFAIGLATSADGINWTAYSSNPIIVANQSWEGSNVDGPTVLYDGAKYEMFYHSDTNIGYATSTDGINWTKPADKNPILTPSQPFDISRVHAPSALKLSNNTVALYYDGQGDIGGINTFRIGLATDGPIVLATPTPTPTPTPMSPVVVIPGMFASWNKDALLHNDKVDDAAWKLPKFIHEYDGLTQTLKNLGFAEGSGLFVFTYDWRKKLTDLADSLNTYIIAKIPAEKKVNLVGHSLGGLVGRIYAQKYGTTRIDKLITVGTPHQGVPQAYKAFAGGDIFRDNNLEWLAMKLIFVLNRNSGQTDRSVVADRLPVTQDLLPIYNFLQKIDGTFIDAATMMYKNDTLLTYKNSFSSIFPLFQSITGQKGATPLGYTINPASSNDLSKNIYPDGRPISDTTAAGDFTVVAQSAAADVDVKTLAAEHGELVYTNDNIKEILNSLALSYTDANITAGRATKLFPDLIITVRSPATITLEKNGKMYTEDDGIIFVENADYGTYQLNVKGTAKGKYTVTVGQITDTNDYWDDIKGEITKSPPGDQTDIYFINFPSNPLFSSGGSSTSVTPTPTPTQKTLVGMVKSFFSTKNEEILGTATESATIASDAATPTEDSYQERAKPSNDLMKWIIGIILALILLLLGRKLRNKYKKP